MDKKKTIMIGIIVLTIVMISGVSFALWQINLTADSTNTITTGCFRVSMEEQNPISLENAFPITKEEGKSLTPYTFTITNTCETYASYQINLEILNNTTFENLDYFDILFEDNIFTLREKETVPTTLSNATTARKLETGYLDANESKTFELRIWLDENTPNDEAFMDEIFSSKITVIATHQTEFDREKPIATILAQKENGVVSIDASKSTDNDSIKNYYYSLDGENWILSKENKYEFIEEIAYGNATETISKKEQNEITDVYLKVEDEHGNMSEVQHVSIQSDFAYDNTTDNNLRYIGSDPNNYVLFNDELWRIIGVMENIDDGTDKKESRIKLIRNDSIGAYSWDASESNYMNGQGVNEWSLSKLKRILNEEAYWNRTTGICYINQGAVSTPCNFTKTGMTAIGKSMIDDVVWHTGANDGETWIGNQVTTPQFYELERSNYNGASCLGVCNDAVERTTSWTGKVGLINPSDYGYATSGGQITSRGVCLSSLQSDWANYQDCYINNWMFRKEQSWWTINPSKKSANNINRVYYVYDSGINNAAHPYGNYEVYPVVYLKKSIQIASGLGTKENPFELSL